MKAEYISHMGDDLLVVNAARVSFDKESDYELLPPDGGIPELPQGDKKLIKYLAKHNHWTPFSHPQICMRETVPIPIARQRFKHMVGFTYNEVSRRYVSDAPDYYRPDMWRSKPEGSMKQGSGAPIESQNEWHVAYEQFLRTGDKLYHDMLTAGIAPEQARFVLPQAMNTSYYVTGSLAAWARAYKQRIDDHAQKEIQDLARYWGEIIEPLFPESWKVLTES